tara:strand:- start:2209 stop:2703 length:495 start_codon:yes stop_codon:yes gene_type:complete
MSCEESLACIQKQKQNTEDSFFLIIIFFFVFFVTITLTIIVCKAIIVSTTCTFTDDYTELAKKYFAASIIQQKQRQWIIQQDYQHKRKTIIKLQSWFRELKCTCNCNYNTYKCYKCNELVCSIHGEWFSLDDDDCCKWKCKDDCLLRKEKVEQIFTKRRRKFLI